MERQKLLKRKPAALTGRMAAIPALFLLMLFAGSTTAYAADYDLYIGSTQVTDANAGDIFGNGTARYDAGTKTLYLSGVHISADNYYEVPGNEYRATHHYSMYAGKNVVTHLVITGNNSFVSAGSENVYCYEPTATDDSGWTADANGDGIINAEDMTPTYPSLAESGIYFSATGTGSDNAFTITGTGTLTSTSTEGYCHDYDDNNGELLGENGYRRKENIGTALTIAGSGWVYMGNEDGTGPRLELTGWNAGANFGNARRFAMQGGTIIAKATSSTMGTGVQLPGAATNFFEGGTIAGYGKYNKSKNEGGAFSPSTGTFDTQISKNHGMQRVYPATIENDDTDIYDKTRPLKIREISGWAVVGMTADGFKEKTDAVLQELGLDGPGGSTDPGGTGGDAGGGTDTGEISGGSYHAGTDTDPSTFPGSTDIDVWGYSENTKYSVDVEWGAMTFEYKADWNATSHQMEGGAWKVYDNAANAAVDDTQSNINKVTVTNHSNAAVYAQLSYTAETAYADTKGTFANSANASTENVNATWKDTDAANHSTGYLTLGTAANADGSEGTAAKGNIYFMPEGISDAVKTSGIAKWTKIGKITVGILTEQPE